MRRGRAFHHIAGSALLAAAVGLAGCADEPGTRDIEAALSDVWDGVYFNGQPMAEIVELETVDGWWADEDLGLYVVEVKYTVRFNGSSRDVRRQLGADPRNTPQLMAIEREFGTFEEGDTHSGTAQFTFEQTAGGWDWAGG